MRSTKSLGKQEDEEPELPKHKNGKKVRKGSVGACIDRKGPGRPHRT